MNPARWSFRTLFLGGFIVCFALIAFALYAQYVLQMNPCPLCILQRETFIALGVVFLIGGLHAPRARGRWFYVGFVSILALIGIGIAWRHLWIQAQPPGTVASCGAPLGYLMETRDAHGGVIGVLRMVLSGSGECATVERILGLPIPVWSLVWFSLLGTGALFARWRKS
jgi:protein dithiol:quinone oxidoreductase